ncbi:Tyrocidine synthase 3 [Paenibacillus plantiphilus]|uniref:Tyrocidine synthase 3 n=1 Tax=Paenibacillus plantiphilus TaxID=2905650 RepID=A0ABN8G8D2_9BACL|nr:non-ribosomal peptide synthetase [Paenibacillus plantiphilus]CAH1202740.1 Tyrocidine synthase 3 [Paenibacillus plantiphilus]
MMNHWKDRLDELPKDQRALLLAKLKQSKRKEEMKPIERIQRTGNTFPVSAAQRPIWFFDQLEPETPMYNIAAQVRLVGALDVELLHRSLGDIVKRHESLRTIFEVNGQGEPVQRILATMDVPLELVCVKDAPIAEQGEAIERIARTASRAPFHLSAGPLVRIAMVRQSDTAHTIIFVVHHIVADYLSIMRIVEETLRSYERHLGGAGEFEEAAADEKRLHYIDAAAWQETTLEEVKEKQLAYWREQLAGVLPILELPAQASRPPVQTYRGRTFKFAMDAPLLERVKAFANDKEATVFMTLMTAYQALLNRYTGDSDIIVGFNTSGRSRRELEHVVGTFAGTLPLRTEIQGDRPFADLLDTVKARMLAAMDHGDVPFNMLADEWNAVHDPSHHPIFQTLFNVNKLAAEQDMSGLSFSFELLDTGTSKFDLSLEIYLGENDAFCMFEYNADLFQEEQMSRMAEHYINLLDAAMNEPATAIRQLSILTDKERELLRRWNDTQWTLPETGTIHEMIALRAHETADRIAVRCGSRSLTYGELEEQANRLASCLRERGVSKGAAVGVCMDRSEQYLIALIAVFKAGGIYIPIDPAYPAQRIQHMIAKADIGLAIASEACKDKLPGGDIEIVNPMALSERSALDLSPSAAAVVVEPDDPAYIIFTSGSTGLPKGAGVYHLGMLNHAAAKIKDMEITENDIIGQNASQSFDISVWQCLVPLMAGGTVVVYPDETARDVVALMNSAEADRLTILELVPSMLGSFLSMIEAGIIEAPKLRELRYLVLTGEALPAALARRWFLSYPDIPLVNAYGPTECSDDVTHHILASAPHESIASIPIGKPVINTQLHVLDDRLELVPIGIPGEIYVSGRCLGMGYINDAEKTAAAFLPHPFPTEPDERIYRTGDRGYWTDNGELIYMGRIDHQVKIRGFRIELGEIEATIDSLPNVRHNVVLIIEEETGENSIAAYIVMAAGAEQSAQAIHELLKSRLPEYMIPLYVVFLEALPLTANGKIDRKALPIPERALPANEETAHPMTEVELAIAGIWRDSLGVQSVGVRDSFFELGGNSLLATQIVYRMRAEFEVSEELTLRTFFRDATIGSIAGFIALKGASEAAATAAPLRPIPSRPQEELVELSHAQKRFWFHMQYSEDEALGMVWATELEGPLQTDIFLESFRRTALRHDMMHSVVEEVDGIPYLKTADTHLPNIVYSDLTDLTYEAGMREVAAFMSSEQARPFAISGEPFFRIALFKLDSERHVLIVNAHHIGADAWSHQVVMDDVGAYYNAAVQGGEAALQPVVQYRDFIHWQADRLERGELDQQRAYWKRQLSEDVELPQLPLDNLTVSERSELEASPTRRHVFGQPLAGRLRQLAAATGGSIFTVVLAGLNIWLAKRCNQTTITIGSTMFGRIHPDLERVCGLFINPVVLRTDLSGNPSGYEVIESVTAGTYEAFANQEYTYDLVVRDARSQSGEDKTLFNIVLIGQNNASHGLKLQDIAARPLKEERRGAVRRDVQDDKSKVKDDLQFSLYESESEIAIHTLYNGDKFYPSSIDAFLTEIEYVLNQLGDDPSIKLARMNIQSVDETADWDEIFA